MATIGKSNNETRTNETPTSEKQTSQNSINQKSTSQATNTTISGTTPSSWSRRQMAIATMAGFAIVGLLLAVSACSKQSPKPALVGVSSPVSAPAAAALVTTPAVATSPAPNSLETNSPEPKKSASRKRPANVVYSDPNYGVSFLYPRKFALASGEKAQPQLAGLGDVPMNFVLPGGVAVATVSAPRGSYPGTDFASAFFNVNVNRSISEQECEHFAFVDTRTPDGEPVDAEKVKIGSTDMETTSTFTGSAMTQAATQYYHSYENGACYEYVLGLNTAGYGTKESIEPVERDQVFAKLEKILATVKVNPSGPEPVIETAGGAASGKE